LATVLAAFDAAFMTILAWVGRAGRASRHAGRRSL
jgi:hypothetical protein